MGFNLSRPAYIAAVAYFFMALVILLPFNINGNMYSEEDGEISTPYKFTQRLHMLMLLIIPIGLSVYSINCYVIGKCVTWGYVNAILIVVWVLLFILASVISSNAQSEQTEEFIRKI